MNTQQQIALLKAYKLQNPRKYALKYGDKTPEEITLPPAAPFLTGSVKIEMGETKEVEQEFKPAPEPAPAPVQEPKPIKTKPKKGQNTPTNA